MTMTKTIYLAGGCFWGAEHFLKMIDGVLETAVGYANSKQESPTYQEVCTGIPDAAECVEVIYDPEKVPLEDLLGLFFKIIDPTSIDKQGEDRGRQYRTGIFYKAEEYHQDYLGKNPGGYCHVPQQKFIIARQYRKKQGTDL